MRLAYPFPMRVRALLVLAVLVLTAACRDDDPSTTPTTSTVASTTSTSAATNTTADPGATTTTKADEAGGEGIDPLTGATTATKSVAATNTETALLTAVRAARQEGYDRVVFEFRNVLPGYQIGYADRPVLADGSGDEVTVAGDHVVVARFESALDADLNDESAPLTYTGPQRFSPGTPVVAELVRIGGNEGVLTWAVGLRDRVDFRVFTLTSPPRVVIDFRNH